MRIIKCFLILVTIILLSTSCSVKQVSESSEENDKTSETLLSLTIDERPDEALRIVWGDDLNVSKKDVSNDKMRKIKREYIEKIVELGYDENEHGLYFDDINGDLLPEMIFAVNPYGYNYLLYYTKEGVEVLTLETMSAHGGTFYINTTHQIINIVFISAVNGGYADLEINIYNWSGSKYELDKCLIRSGGFKDNNGKITYGKESINNKQASESEFAKELENINDILMKNYDFTPFKADENGKLVGDPQLLFDNIHDICLWNGDFKFDEEMRSVLEDTRGSSHFSIEIFYNEILSVINAERNELGCSPLALDNRLCSACAVLCNDLKNDKYKKGTSNDYFREFYSDSNFYYERSYDLSAYIDEFKAATELLKYEADNYSSKWRESKYTHLGIYAEKNKDGTFYIVWVMASNK